MKDVGRNSMHGLCPYALVETGACEVQYDDLNCLALVQLLLFKTVYEIVDLQGYWG